MPETSGICRGARGLPPLVPPLVIDPDDPVVADAGCERGTGDFHPAPIADVFPGWEWVQQHQRLDDRSAGSGHIAGASDDDRMTGAVTFGEADDDCATMAQLINNTLGGGAPAAAIALTTYLLPRLSILQLFRLAVMAPKSPPQSGNRPLGSTP